ncbi:MAG: 30S ribosomal protein S14 [Candidatus Micrarchaeota archaeon]
MKEKKGVPLEDKFKGKGKRMCKLCQTSRGLIRKYKLYVCRRCFREVGEHIGFKKYGI